MVTSVRLISWIFKNETQNKTITSTKFQIIMINFFQRLCACASTCLHVVVQLHVHFRPTLWRLVTWRHETWRCVFWLLTINLLFLTRTSKFCLPRQLVSLPFQLSEFEFWALLAFFGFLLLSYAFSKIRPIKRCVGLSKNLKPFFV